MEVCGAAATALPGDAAGAEERYFSISDLIILFPGPEPLICFRGMPCSRARRRAMGDAKIGPPRSWVEEEGAEGSSFLVGSEDCLGCFWSSLGSGSGSSGSFWGGSCSVVLGADLAPPASSIVKSLKASTEDSSSTITAMG